MKAVVLAAGEGARLRPLTMTRPKHMLPIAGRPALEHLLLAIRDSGIRQIILVVGYGSKMVESYFKDGKNLGLDLTYVYQEKPLGTAHALSLSEEYISEDYFLLIYGDLYIHASLIKSLIQKHSETDMMSMAVVPVKNPQQFGVVNLKNGFVKAIIEKPKAENGDTALANGGIYVLSETIFPENSKIRASSRAEFEITDTLQLVIDKGTPIVSTIVNPECWLDLGRPWDLLEANERALKNSKLEVKGIIERGATIIGDVGIEEGVRIRSGSYLEGPIFIDTGSDIGPNCYIRPFTSIGRNVRIGNACEIKASIIFDNTHIGHLSYIGDSIVGENCNLGAGTITANLRLDNDTVKVMIKSDLIDSGRKKLGVILGDNVKTGIAVNLMPGVKLGLNVHISPNATIYRDVD